VRIKRVAIGAAVVAAAGAVALAALAWRAGSEPAGAAASAVAPVQTTVVTRMDLANTQQLGGSLGHGAAEPVTGAKSGIITWLPASGVTVSRGQPLYRVDNQPVPVFYGKTPLYRTLSTVDLVGPDVRMVADNLTALGYDIGFQPPVGSNITVPVARGRSVPSVSARPTVTVTVTAKPTGRPAATAGSSPTPTLSPTPTTSASAKDSVTPSSTATTDARIDPARVTVQPTSVTVGPGEAVLTRSLMDAIGRWQAAAGMSPTGVLNVGDVVVEPGAVQVGAIEAQLGDSAVGSLMTITATAKVVTVSVDAADIDWLREGDKVAITLPDNSSTGGTVTSISTAVQSAATGSDGQPQVNVTVSLEHPAAARGLNSASVQVTFTVATIKGVLAVPVGSLLALRGGGYALQLPGGRLIAVQTGMFAQGMVQVSGPGIAAGLRVVTTT
jgi:hypothetical protein